MGCIRNALSAAVLVLFTAGSRPAVALDSNALAARLSELANDVMGKACVRARARVRLPALTLFWSWHCHYQELYGRQHATPRHASHPRQLSNVQPTDAATLNHARPRVATCTCPGASNFQKLIDEGKIGTSMDPR